MYTIDILPEIDLPDDSLADSDLRDHDFMDNLMYIYYGSHNKAGTNYGSEIIIIGSVLSCAAQLLTIFIVLLRKNLHGNKKDINCTFLQFMISLCFSNLLFMLGIYSTKNELKCQIIGLTLHYMHLLTAFWIFTFSYYIYKRNCHNTPVPRTKILYSLTYCIPLVVTVVSFALLPKSFETKKFCFISVERGMIVNYMLPVFLLIMLTTAYSLTGVGNINIELSKLEFTSSAESLNVIKAELDLERRMPDCMDGEIIILKESKTCLISLCLLQSIYNIVWFIAVVALENDDKSNNMAIAYSITSCLMNWYIFARSKSFLPNIPNNHMQLEENIMNPEKLMATNTVMVSRRGSSDDIPLLITSETEMREISRSDHISTITI
ncbi:PREDICTED: adhesion G protein-coupled receptor E4-like isoform X2 [Nicrophorus vespilloides]|uniref:Adhesion G protein-coupled receptor E4-like isoform X2 n=1 Tax=Nicrophorus vespilloides TaxID=110193 RepID=A0ABM1MTT6_NICVS|nr:PREDICTED: adhesion G protein-coupled receptor E4-like isoform X2 [Nicrophorus vespilloides]